MTMPAAGGYNGTIGVTLNVGPVAQALAQQQNKQNSPQKSKDPDGSKTIKSLFAMVTSLTAISKSSKIIQTYSSAFGKIFGAAIDLLLIPFIPVFNVLLVIMSRLLVWMITSGLLERLSVTATKIADNIMRLYNWFESWSGKSWGEIFTEAFNGILESLKGIWEWWKGADWSERLATVLGGLLIWKTLNAALGGGPGGVAELITSALLRAPLEVKIAAVAAGVILAATLWGASQAEEREKKRIAGLPPTTDPAELERRKQGPELESTSYILRSAMAVDAAMGAADLSGIADMKLRQDAYKGTPAEGTDALSQISKSIQKGFEWAMIQMIPPEVKIVIDQQAKEQGITAKSNMSGGW